MTRKTHALAAVAALTLAAGAHAQAPGAPSSSDVTVAPTAMAKLDKNADGKVSKAEAAADKKVAAQFDMLDANKDGAIDAMEYAKLETKPGAASPGGKPSGY
jgi:uncharacterized low-complexity protein